MKFLYLKSNGCIKAALLLAISGALFACSGERTLDMTKDPTGGKTLFDMPTPVILGLIVIAGVFWAWEKIKDFFNK